MPPLAGLLELLACVCCPTAVAVGEMMPPALRAAGTAGHRQLNADVTERLSALCVGAFQATGDTEQGSADLLSQGLRLFSVTASKPRTYKTGPRYHAVAPAKAGVHRFPPARE
jgi:hypothetical protein